MFLQFRPICAPIGNQNNHETHDWRDAVVVARSISVVLDLNPFGTESSLIHNSLSIISNDTVVYANSYSRLGTFSTPYSRYYNIMMLRI
jgi:hypothetical protein